MLQKEEVVQYPQLRPAGRIKIPELSRKEESGGAQKQSDEYTLSPLKNCLRFHSVDVIARKLLFLP